jgi:D-3-phosphoglycerate dehydrogenase / 2-oxoglutarate reductase
VAALPDQPGVAGFSAEGTVLHDGTPRVINIDGIPLESLLDGSMLYIRNLDQPGVIGYVGTTLGQHGVNIATFSLGRREAAQGAEAVSLVRVDGNVSEAILEPLKQNRAITQAKLIHLG